jgi:hypothetical protein
MPNPQKSTNGFESLISKNEGLLRHLYYLNMKICDICIQSIDEIDKQYKVKAVGRKLIESHYSKHAAIVEAAIDLLGYEPDFQECHSVYGQE